MSDKPAPDPIVYTDSIDDSHTQTIADQLSQALNQPVDPRDVKPAVDQPPTLADVDELEQREQPEPEVIDLMRGLQGKPRTAKARELLEAKKQMLEKKYGRQVELVVKEK